ncbi:MAG: hypothetical protein HC923_03300 [Myxococcales bacterium]|nr:hypothetical protein [Myxococcales bacterium]
MRAQMEVVQEKLAEARQAAQEYNRLNDQATQLLAQTVPPNVKAEVEVQLNHFPQRIDIETRQETRTIEVETTQLPREDRELDEDDEVRQETMRPGRERMERQLPMNQGTYSNDENPGRRN